MTVFDLLYKFLLEDLQIFIPPIRCLLYLFEVHVQSLRITLYLLNTFDYLFLEYLLTFFHLVNFPVEWFIL